jgi:accessory colonization factor AcfC
MRESRRPFLPIIALTLAFMSTSAWAHDILRLYGPGGPAPAMKEAAEAFQAERGIPVEVTAGPSDKWMGKAKKDADIIFSGSENMMTSFVRELGGVILEETVRPLFIRPSTILVRPGNPKNIAGIRDLLEPGVKILVVEGAGQIGLWEDVVGRTGSLEMIRAFRSNIVWHAKNSGEAKEQWTKEPSLDAWLIWNIWEVANPDIADQVEVEPELRIWRDTAVALTRGGEAKPYAAEFIEFLESDKGRAIFAKWGWK